MRLLEPKMPTSDQTPEEKARDKIDAKLRSSGWEIQDGHG